LKKHRRKKEYKYVDKCIYVTDPEDYMYHMPNVRPSLFGIMEYNE